jgi:ABC-type amino acid transport substrate-binding protein
VVEDYESSDASSRTRANIAIVIALIALAAAVWAFFRRTVQIPNGGPVTVPAGLLARTEKTNELHAGYGVYPPYTQEDPITKKVSGFSVDLIEQIAKELKCRVVWHRLNWNTMAPDLKRGTYDVVADPIFVTIPRAREFTFTDPYAWFADGIAVARRKESRFATLDSLDQPGVIIAVGQGWASETLIRARFSKATIRPIPTTTDLLQVFNEVTGGRADVAVADGADAQRYASEHVDQVKVLFLDHPPAYMPAGFALRPGDVSGQQFLNAALLNLQATGVLDALARKYRVVVRPVGSQ